MAKMDYRGWMGSRDRPGLKGTLVVPAILGYPVKRVLMDSLELQV